VIRFALLFSVIMVCYDAICAFIAAGAGVAYDSFIVPAVVLFIFMGILAGRKMHGWGGLVPVLVAAIVHTTLGWYVAWLIGPGAIPNWTPEAVAIEITAGLAAALVFGAAGVAVGIRVGRTAR
jgi:hypothetical protein